MSIQTADNAGQAQEILQLFRQWCARAETFDAVDSSRYGDSFILSGEWGAFRVLIGPNGGRVFWSSLARHPRLVDISPTAVINAEDSSPLDLVTCRAMIDMLQSPTSEIVPLVQVPYGIVANNRIVAITFTTDVNKASVMRRDDLGLNPDTYVAEPGTYMRLCPVQNNRGKWYTNLWALYRHGSAIRLSDRVKHLSGIRVQREGSELWIEVQGPDDRTPAFLLGERYIAWDTTNNTPSHRQRTGPSTMNRSLKEWFN